MLTRLQEETMYVCIVMDYYETGTQTYTLIPWRAPVGAVNGVVRLYDLELNE